MRLTLLSLFAGTAVSAMAVSLPYQIGSGTVSAYDTIPSNQGLEIHTSVSISPATFNLNDGQSQVVNFFTIWTTEGTVNSGEDQAPKTITATLNFSLPNSSAIIGGVTFGGFLFAPPTDILNGYGHVQWNSVATIDLPGDRKFTVSLNDADFNRGGVFGDLEPGAATGALIKATITQISSNAPDGGATLTMLGAGVAALGAVRRRIR